MEPFEQSPNGRLNAGKRQHGVDEFGMAGMKGRGETHIMGKAPASCGKPHRAFGGNVNGIRQKRLNLAPNGTRTDECQADFRIERQRKSAPSLRHDEPQLMTLRLQFTFGLLQRSHHPIHLRGPGV